VLLYADEDKAFCSPIDYQHGYVCTHAGSIVRNCSHICGEPLPRHVTTRDDKLPVTFTVWVCRGQPWWIYLINLIRYNHVLTSIGRNGLNPFAAVSIDVPRLEQRRIYDVSVTLSMPLSPPNLELGNFMVNLYLLGGSSPPSSNLEASNGIVLYHSRRATMLPYRTKLSYFTGLFFSIPWYIFSDTAESHTLTVTLGNSIQFNGIGEVPRIAYVELEAGQHIQTYYAMLNFATGKRWLHALLRWCYIPAIAMLAMILWILELFFAGAAWLILDQLAPIVAHHQPRDRNRPSHPDAVVTVGRRVAHEDGLVVR